MSRIIYILGTASSLQFKRPSGYSCLLGIQSAEININFRINTILAQFIQKLSTQKKKKEKRKRKSSCVNARGIPTAAYQVLHLLPEVGYPPPTGVRSSPRPGLRSDRGGYLRWGTPLARSNGGGTPRQGTPPARFDGGYPRWGNPPSWTWPGWGTPPARTWPGYPPPPPGVDRQIHKKHNLSVLLRTRSVKKKKHNESSQLVTTFPAMFIYARVHVFPN